MLSRRTSDFPEWEQYPEWKDLLTVLLAAIAKRLTSPGDYCSFRGVCTSWRSAATFDNLDRGFTRVPCLLYFVEEKEETPVRDAVSERREETPVLGDAVSERREETPILGDEAAEIEGSPILGDEDRISGKEVKKIVSNLWNLESNTHQITNFPPGRRRLLSCSGWIICVSEDYSEVCLKHFMLSINIKLPSLNVFISKMVLSGSPLEVGDDLVVMVIWGMDDELAFCRPGDESWTVIDYWDDYKFFYDIIYHNGKLYALDSCLTVWECDVHGSNPTKLVQEVFGFTRDVDYDKINRPGIVQRFLVESNGKFLIVLHCMFHHFFDHESHRFWIYEIDLKDGGYNEIDNLGRRSLFLGLNSSICVEFPDVGTSRVKLNPNCIYLSHTKSYSMFPDVGVVYALCDHCDGSLEDLSGKLDCCFPPPTWVVPTF